MDGGLDNKDAQYSKEAYKQIGKLFEEFKNEVTELINSLDSLVKK